MALDGIFLHLLKNEISSVLVGNRVDKIYQPSRDEILFSFRTKDGLKKLLMSAKADCTAVYLASEHIENPQKPPMLTMLLRKYLINGILTDIIQDGFERILTFVFDCRNDLGDRVEYKIICEIMGRYSNIIFVDSNGKIIDCIKRVDSLTSSVREILPGLQYSLPPAQHKLNILNDDAQDIESAIKNCSEKRLSKAVQSTVQGVSPIVAREFENGLTVDKLKEHIFNPEPTAVIGERPIDFTYFCPMQYGSLCSYKKFDSLSSLLEFYYYERSKTDRIKQRSNDLFKLLTTLRDRALRKAENRRAELDDCRDCDKYRIYGDLITTYAHMLEKGSFYYDLPNYYDNNTVVRIAADPAREPSANAAKYYKEYRKKQTALAKLNDFIESAQHEAEYLDSVIDSLSRAESDSEISAIREELSQGGFVKKRGSKKAKSKKLPARKFITDEGFTVFVGRNNVQNDQLTLKTAKNYDLWFHVKDAPGSHVVVTAQQDKPFTDKLIRQAAMLAAQNSKAAGSSNVAVDYTIIKNVHKSNGAKPGMVIYDNYNTEYVTPNDEELSQVTEID